MAIIPKSAPVNVATATDHTIVAAVTGHRIVVKGWHLICDGAVAVTPKSGSTTLSGALSFAANGGSVLPVSESGWLATAAGEALVFTLGGAVGVRGWVTYEIVSAG